MAGLARPYNVTGTATVYDKQCTYRGFTISSAAGATVTIYNNTAASGTVLAEFTLGANGFQHVDVAGGVHCDLGVHLVASAAIKGHVRIG